MWIRSTDWQPGGEIQRIEERLGISSPQCGDVRTSAQVATTAVAQVTVPRQRFVSGSGATTVRSDPCHASRNT
jgi:hypothetical protein